LNPPAFSHETHPPQTKGARDIGRPFANLNHSITALFTEASSVLLFVSSPQEFAHAELASPGAPAPEAECFAADGRSAEELKDAQPARCVAAAALPDDSSLAELLRVGLVRAGSAPDGCWVALGADDLFAPEALPDDSSPAELLRVGLVRAGSARDGCWVARRADDPFAPEALPDDYSASVRDGCSAPVDCSGQGGSVARDLRPDARSRPVD
jgi:hypothetical protein